MNEIFAFLPSTKKNVNNVDNATLVAKGALAHCLQNPIWPPRGPKMADGVWSTPSMRKGRDGENGEKREGKNGKKKTGEKKRKIRMKIVATTSLPAGARPNAGTQHARANYKVCS